MISITLKFTGEMWERTKVYATRFTFEGATLGDLLWQVFTHYPVHDLVLDEREQFIFRSGVLINGRSAKYIGGLAAPIRNGDEVIVMRPSIGAM